MGKKIREICNTELNSNFNCMLCDRIFDELAASRFDELYDIKSLPDTAWSGLETVYLDNSASDNIRKQYLSHFNYADVLF